MQGETTSTSNGGMLTNREALTLVTRLARVRGARGVTDGQAAKLLSWANEARVQQWRLADVLAGRLSVDVDDASGELRFGPPASGAATSAAAGRGLGSAHVQETVRETQEGQVTA